MNALEKYAAKRRLSAKLTEAMHTGRAKHAFAAPISTAPISTAISLAPPTAGKVGVGGSGKAPSKNAGAPNGPRAVSVKGVKASPLKPPVTNA